MTPEIKKALDLALDRAVPSILSPGWVMIPDKDFDAIKQALAAPVQDEHQSFIDSLPKDFDDKMFMQIDHWARQSYKRHQSSVRCQAITAADSYESHVIWATLRWAKENTPPAGEKQ